MKEVRFYRAIKSFRIRYPKITTMSQTLAEFTCDEARKAVCRQLGGSYNTQYGKYETARKGMAVNAGALKSEAKKLQDAGCKGNWVYPTKYWRVENWEIRKS